MGRRLSILTLAAVVIALVSTTSLAERRVALVVGNADYPAVGNLRNPLADAAAIAGVLQKLGFEVTSKQNIGAQEFRAALASFAESSSGAELSLVYFAGHGVELDGTNYLVPTDAKLERKVAARFEAIALDDVREAVAGASKLRVVILDACRNNPFKLAGKDGKRSASRGLARVEPNTNELIAYSAREGTLAADGEGDNSPFALALIKHLAEPGIEVGYLFRKVRGDVVAATNGVQEPFVYATLGEEQLYFNPPTGGTVEATKPDKPAPVEAVEKPAAEAGDAAVEYGLVKGTTNEQVLLEYIQKHGSAPIWGARAKEDLEELRRGRVKPAETEVAVVAPPTVATPACSDLSLIAEVAGKPTCIGVLDAFRDIDDGPEMVALPAGSFMMGSPDHYGAQPVHQVTIARPFAMGRHEVTVDQFSAFVTATGYVGGSACWTNEGKEHDERQGRTFLAPGYPVTGSHPASCVNRDDVVAYTKWLSGVTGKIYRLPSEAEWEYAARAGTTTDAVSSDDESRLCGVANGGDQSAKGLLRSSNIIACDDGHKYTAPVGSLRENAFRLFDMIGNLEEWMEDCHINSYEGAPADGSASTKTDNGICIHVTRGGAWDDGWRGSLAPAERGFNSGYVREWNLGFRVVREF